MFNLHRLGSVPELLDSREPLKERLCDEKTAVFPVDVVLS